MVTKPKATRKQQFNAALALAGTTKQEWAEAQGVTVTHLNYFLDGERSSAPLDAAVSQFIRAQAGKMAVVSAEAA